MLRMGDEYAHPMSLHLQHRRQTAFVIREDRGADPVVSEVSSHQLGLDPGVGEADRYGAAGLLFPAGPEEAGEQTGALGGRFRVGVRSAMRPIAHVATMRVAPQRCHICWGVWPAPTRTWRHQYERCGIPLAEQSRRYRACL
jgi:hypothetical protein